MRLATPPAPGRLSPRLRASSTIERRALPWTLGLVGLAVAALAWQGLAVWLHSLMLPTFTSTARALARLAGTRELWTALWISNQAAALGFLGAAVAGIAIGLAMGRWVRVEQAVNPYLSILLAVPKASLIPLLVMAAGLGLASRVLVVFSFAVVSVAVNTRAGLALVDPDWVEMARAFGATERQVWRQVWLPGARPGIMAGLRLGVVRSVSGMVAAELLLLALGVGRLMLDFQNRFEADRLYATILVVVGEAVALIQAVTWLERRVGKRLGVAAVE